mmetsp:Transcript_85103/g.244267  ORF Transcript_85103/g.244267 Transcript_85103/m.244267 type:complete len:703 (-) Transcript_85103:70-2178(-)|eukprot:CAMPEP_0177205338 /NCGR_PEP_ID=MMETSP0367-20130122/28813_1 /TAXON_ID=447022 ORGANISM="Scrippsiella hangoei-like, Strain SHHI-4" /NCGR_SAMPLE_ID=MMETSP0367 /ASSEMBLY_ACC=CAM_ASM_000362 /LENGTH=702 /DNA_ID=CAMNT_0018654065 /DNA_START=1 /DNA_END=2109 /DNA_ORIENTATION=-
MKALPGPDARFQNQQIATTGSYRHQAGGGALVPTVPGKGIEPTVPGTQPTRPNLTDKQMDFLVAKEETRQENLSECRGICMFFVFLFVFTLGMIFDSNSSSARLADHIRDKIEHGPIELVSVKTIPQMYDYLRQTVVPALYENSTDTNMALDLSSYYHPIDVPNRMVGGLRLRQARVKYTEDCQVGPLFASYTIRCYPAIGPETESQDVFGPELKFQYQKDSTGTPYVGYLGSYSPDGYIEVLSTDVSKANTQIDNLQKDDFSGPWTRALFIDFIVWNSNFGTYATATINLEFGASGGVASHVAILTLSPRALSAGGLGDSTDMTAMAFLVLVLIFVLYFMFEESQEIKQGIFAYFKDGWNVLDWLNMALLLTAFGVRIFVWIEAGGMQIGVAQLTDKDLFKSMRGVAVMVELVKLLNSVNAVILYAKVVKYLRHMPVTKDLIKTFWKALDLFVPFLCMFVIAFTGFAMSFNVGFGDKIWELSTLGSALTYLSRAFLKDVKLMPAYSIMPAFGSLLIIIFYIVFLVLGVNVLFATITDAMLRAKTEERQKKDDQYDLHEDEPVEEFIREVRKRVKRQIRRRAPRIYKKIYGKKRKAIAGVHAVEDKNIDKAEIVLAESESDESNDEFGDHGPQLPSKENLMKSIEHMAGRILSEVSIVGIEIKSELHDVCERVAQMQMAVEELSMRTDGVRLDQEEFLAMQG